MNLELRAVDVVPFKDVDSSGGKKEETWLEAHLGETCLVVLGKNSVKSRGIAVDPDLGLNENVVSEGPIDERLL